MTLESVLKLCCVFQPIFMTLSSAQSCVLKSYKFSNRAKKDILLIILLTHFTMLTNYTLFEKGACNVATVETFLAPCELHQDKNKH